MTTVGFSIVSFPKLHDTAQCLSKNLELFLRTPSLAACRVNSANCVGFFGNYILSMLNLHPRLLNIEGYLNILKALESLLMFSRLTLKASL